MTASRVILRCAELIAMESRVKLLVLIASDRLHSHTHEDICVRLVLMEMKKGLKRGADVPQAETKKRNPRKKQ